MEALNEKEKQALKDAVDKQRKDEEFERSLGRAMRGLGMDFDAYIELVGKVRDRAMSKKIPLDQAATELANE
jgi:hypothetical protein